MDGRVLVTGGAGFIGSHLVDALMEMGSSVVVLDNMSSGRRENLKRWIGDEKLELIVGDCLNPKDVERALDGCEMVFHLAANAEVRRGVSDTRIDLEQNVMATYNLLEGMRKSGTAKTLAFTSTSTVYGEADVIPTPEGYGPLRPISLYGASKLACEAMISAYSHMFGFRSIVYRFANIIGSRSRHGVIWDFIHKLLSNPKELEILGDGRQSKSYLLVDDCVEAMLTGLKGLDSSGSNFEIYNIGSEDQVDVTTIARVVVECMGLRDVRFRYKVDVEGGVGWVGDVKFMLLDISKIKRLGWRPKHNSLEAVREAAESILEEIGYKRKA